MRYSSRYFAFCLTVVGLLLPGAISAQFLAAPQPGDIFREFTRNIPTSNCNTCVTDPSTGLADARANLPNDVLNITISDLQGAIRAELVIDHNIGHVGTTNKKVRFNGNAWINMPELGAGNGIPAGHDGQCYSQQFNPTIQIPLSHLIQGTNLFQGTSGSQSCYNFGWGLWAWYEAMVRVYYGPGKAHPTGAITSPGNGATIGENPTIAATTSGDAVQVDFLGYYDGYDADGDGVGQQYHYNYHRGKTETSMLMKGHIGSDVSSPFSVNWNTDLVPNQGAGSVKLIARIKGSNGVWFVTNAVTGLTLNRGSSYVRIYRAYDMPERFWVRAGSGRSPKSVHFSIPSGDNLANATSVKFLVSTMDADHVAERANYSMKVNSYILPHYGQDHWYSLDALTIPKSAMVQGTNTFTVTCTTVHHGIEILWPGPALVIRFSGNPSSSSPTITVHPVDRTVTIGQTTTFTVGATGTAPLSYQWQKNNVNIGGATSTTYATPATVAGDDGATFRCVVTNNYGNATSNSATLHVTSGNVPPTITGDPADQTTTVGQTATFHVGASGTPSLSYQWQKNTANIGGATAASYTTPATVAGDNGSRFRCIVSNPYGKDTSASALLTVTTGTPATNLIANPGFESGTSPWKFYSSGAGALASVTPGFEGSKAGRISITSAGTNVQLYQDDRTLIAGRQYRLTFSASSSTGHDIQVSILKQISPYPSYGMNSVVFNLTTAWQTFTRTFIASGFSGTISNVRLRFWLAPYDASGDVYFIDGVKLELLPASGAEEFALAGAPGLGTTEVMPTEFSLEANYPNPFNPSTTITYSVPEQASVRLSIYNLLGQEVMTLADGDHTAGNYSVVWDAKDNSGRNVSSGVYIYRMTATAASGKSYQALQKMILMK
jgi:hypothetical protein